MLEPEKAAGIGSTALLRGAGKGREKTEEVIVEYYAQEHEYNYNFNVNDALCTNQT